MLHGDTNARSKLIEHNLRLVAHIVKKFESNTNDVDDLIGIGTVGLIKGIDSFSPDKNVRLTTYIAKCAENEILMYFRADKKNSKNISIYDGIRHYWSAWCMLLCTRLCRSGTDPCCDKTWKKSCIYERMDSRSKQLWTIGKW